MIESESIQSELASKTADELRKLADKIENREMFTLGTKGYTTGEKDVNLVLLNVSTKPFSLRALRRANNK